MRDRPSDRVSVSVVVTAHDQQDLIAEAVGSALAQTHPEVEVLVVDDGSRDGTVAVLEQFPGLRVLRQDNAGVAVARNSGFAASTGEVVCFLDGDDRLRPGAVATGLGHLEATGADFAVGRAQLVDAGGAPLPTHHRPPVPGDLYAELLREAWIAPPATVLARRSALQAVGPWDGGLRHGGEDLDLYLRLARTRPGVDHGEVVCDYRVHGSNRSSSYAACLRDNLRVLATQREHCTGDPRLEQARRAGEEHYSRVFGTKIVLSELLDALRARRGVGSALAAAARHTAREPHSVLATVRTAASRIGRR